MPIRDEYDIAPVDEEPEREREYLEETGEDGPRTVDTVSKRVAEEVARNDARFGRYEAGMDAPGRPYWGHVSGGPTTYRDLRDAFEEQEVAVERVTLEMDAVDDRVEPYEGERAVVVVDDPYQVVVDETSRAIVAVRGLENLFLDVDRVVRHSGFEETCRVLDEYTAIDAYLDDLGITVEEVNDGSGSVLDSVLSKPWSGW